MQTRKTPQECMHSKQEQEGQCRSHRARIYIERPGSDNSSTMHLVAGSGGYLGWGGWSQPLELRKISGSPSRGRRSAHARCGRRKSHATSPYFKCVLNLLKSVVGGARKSSVSLQCKDFDDTPMSSYLIGEGWQPGHEIHLNLSSSSLSQLLSLRSSFAA